MKERIQSLTVVAPTKGDVHRRGNTDAFFI